MLIKNKKINIINLGCRVNAFESNAIAHDLKTNGGFIVDDFRNADICIINTCCVTSKADAKSRYFINKVCKLKKIKLVVVIGCYAQLNDINNLNVGIIVGTKHKNKVVDLIKKYDGNKIIKIASFSKKDNFDEFSNSILCTNTRAFLKIQDGCDYMCSYCLIPFARGRQKSLNHIKVIDSIKTLIKNKYKEIVLTGVNVAGYDDGQ
jgi:threonylcarbamoyladenosine tRNA methylthiotransferase MtaB